MTNNNTMKRIRNKKNQIITRISTHPHPTIFIMLLILSIIINGIMISYIGLSSFLDSFSNSNEYLFIPSEQVIIESSHESSFAAIVQKQSHPSFSMNTTDLLCIKNPQGLYTFHSEIIDSFDTTDSTQVIGKVVAIISDDPLSKIACLWWQQSIHLINKI